MATTDAVVLVRESGLAGLDPQTLILTAIEKGAGIDTMERLVALAKEVREIQAREAWYEAMARFQATCPSIKKTKTARIVGRATYSYSYAPLDEIMSVIQPVMGPLGLSVSWRSRVEVDKVIVSCRVSHTFGHHEESGEIAMPIVVGDGTGANPAQRVGIATTYAKRYALLGIIGMAPEDDEDGAPGGKTDRQEPTGAPNEPGGNNPINEGQLRRFHAIARGSGWNDEQIHDLLTGYKYNSSKEITVTDYEPIVEKVKKGPGKPGAQQTLA